MPTPQSLNKDSKNTINFIGYIGNEKYARRRDAVFLHGYTCFADIGSPYPRVIYSFAFLILYCYADTQQPPG